MELVTAANTDHDPQFRLQVLQGEHVLVDGRTVAQIEATVHQARKTHDNMRTKMRVNVRRTELPERVQVPRYGVITDDDLPA